VQARLEDSQSGRSISRATGKSDTIGIGRIWQVGGGDARGAPPWLPRAPTEPPRRSQRKSGPGARFFLMAITGLPKEDCRLAAAAICGTRRADAAWHRRWPGSHECGVLRIGRLYITGCLGYCNLRANY
jgi:hypothetical protein